MPQPAQFLTSVLVLVSHPLSYILSQSANPPLQEEMAHARSMHLGLPLATAAHALPHMPQFLRSISRLTHMLLHTSGWPVRHWHLPLMQSWLPVQAVPQVPQLLVVLSDTQM